MSGGTAPTRSKPAGRTICVLAVAALAAFVALTALVMAGRTQGFDESALAAIYDSNTPASSAFFRAVTLAGSIYVVAPVTVLAAALCVAVRRYPAALFIAVDVAALWLADTAVNIAVARPRPYVGGTPGLGYGYPSGHTMAGISLYLGLAFIASMELGSRRAKALVWLSAACFSAIIALSRLFLGVHYPTDVVGGALLGTASILALIHFWRCFERAAMRMAATLSNKRP